MTADYDQAVKRHLIDLYEEGGELHALIEMVVETGHLVIENIAVRPDQQGKGIGDRLLRHAEVVAASMNMREVRLITNVTMVSNIAFYSKRGYQDYDRRTITPLGQPSRTGVLMRKTLPSTR
jgi:ribosomal protein S18 acetylase RimI-like enzyme